MTKKTKCLLGIAGSMLAAGSLYAESCSFESDTEGNTPTSWSSGAVTNNGTYASGIAGFPLPEENHTKVLLVEGDSTYTVSGASGALVDMMVQVALPDDALETPESGAHIAVAVDTNGIFNVYCKNKSDAAGWYPLSGKAYADGAWARVSLLFDYGKSLCQVRIDGEPMMTENGYLKTDTTVSGNGAWYTLVTETSSSTAVSNLKVVGCTAIDDVVIAANANNYAVAANATNDVGVSCAWLDKYGLAWDSTTAGTGYDSTGMTVAQKYNACLSPFDDQKFEIKSVKATATKTKVGIPATIAVPGREVVLEYGPTPSMGSETPVTSGETEVEIDLPAAGEVKYFRLKAKAAQ